MCSSDLVNEPGGVLLITPESLESLLVNRPHDLARVFGGLRFAVIDELHAFLHGERGLHLRSLLGRLRRYCTAAGGQSAAGFRVIGLSATLGDMTAAQRYVDPQRPADVVVVTGNAGPSKEVKFRVHGYRPYCRRRSAAALVAARAPRRRGL